MVEGGMSGVLHWVFELNRGARHDHLICVDCGRILEFSDAEIAERQGAIARCYRRRDFVPKWPM